MITHYACLPSHQLFWKRVSTILKKSSVQKQKFTSRLERPLLQYHWYQMLCFRVAGWFISGFPDGAFWVGSNTVTVDPKLRSNQLFLLIGSNQLFLLIQNQLHTKNRGHRKVVDKIKYLGLIGIIYRKFGLTRSVVTLEVWDVETLDEVQ